MVKNFMTRLASLAHPLLKGLLTIIGLATVNTFNKEET
jgi:hypothetical protein